MDEGERSEANPVQWLDDLVTERLAYAVQLAEPDRNTEFVLAEGLVKGAWRALREFGVLRDDHDPAEVLWRELERLKAAGAEETWPTRPDSPNRNPER